MKKSMLLAILLVSSILIVPCFGKVDIAAVQQISPDAWMENGLPVADSANVKSENGFGAQLWLTKDDSIYDSCDSLKTSKIEITKTVVRNLPIFAVFLFVNPGIDSKSNADIIADVIITNPEGEVYGQFQDMEIWQREYDFPKDTIQLAGGNLGLLIEDIDRLGVYKVKAIIKDKIKL